jgi:hypothetical protein
LAPWPTGPRFPLVAGWGVPVLPPAFPVSRTCRLPRPA